MICLIDTEETPDVGVITRVKRARRGYKGVKSRNITVLGMPAVHITLDRSPSMTQKTVLKRIGCAVEMLRAERVRSVVFAKNFPYKEQILREGFDEADNGLLMGTLGGKVASVLSGREKTAVFFARRLTGNAEQTFYDLCRDFRYVMAVIESSGSSLIPTLCKKLGISIVEQPSEKQLLKADVAIFCDPPRRTAVLSDYCIAIPFNAAALHGVVCRKAVNGLTLELADGSAPEIPDGFEPEALYALAIGTGKLRTEDIRLRDINIAETHV